jgi:prophage regulatory protein
MSTKNPLPPLEALRLLRLPQVLACVGLSESRIRQLEAKGQFPRRIALGDRAIGWREFEVRQWLAARMAGSASAPPRSRADAPANTHGNARKAARKGG